VAFVSANLVDHLLDRLHAGTGFKGAVVVRVAGTELSAEHVCAQPLHFPLQRRLLEWTLVQYTEPRGGFGA
jgi:hypothetical protein